MASYGPRYSFPMASYGPRYWFPFLLNAPGHYLMGNDMSKKRVNERECDTIIQKVYFRLIPHSQNSLEFYPHWGNQISDVEKLFMNIVNPAMGVNVGCTCQLLW